jgi:hypothetical protein
LCLLFGVWFYGLVPNPYPMRVYDWEGLNAHPFLVPTHADASWAYLVITYSNFTVVAIRVMAEFTFTGAWGM